jgi:hypothetical protein
MAEGRMLKRRITMSRKMAALKTDKARLLWFYMLPFTNVKGRIVADPEEIQDEILRKQRRGYGALKIQQYLNDLDRVGLIILYQVNGRQFLEFTRFADEQNLNEKREAKCVIPEPPHERSRALQSNHVKLSEVKLSKDKLNESEIQKHKFLDFVFLTDDERKKLIERFGLDKTNDYIERLNNGIGSKGYKYKSHYFTILNWSRKDSHIVPDGKTRLFPIHGKVCGKKGCGLPAVYKSAGEFDHYYCAEHMPDKVKEKYCF